MYINLLYIETIQIKLKYHIIFKGTCFLKYTMTGPYLSAQRV